MVDRRIIVAVVIVAMLIVGGASAYIFSNGDGEGNDDDQTETNDIVTFLIEDGEGVYFWVQGEGDTVLEAWNDAVDNYSIPWVEATGDNATWGEVDSMFGIGSVNDTVDWQSWPLWSSWEVYTWRNTTSEWISDNMGSVNASDCDYCAIYYGNNSVYNYGPSVTPDEAVVWDLSSDDALILIQSPSGLYFWVNGEGATMYDAWTDAAATYDIPWTEESGYDGIDTIFGIEGSGQYYWKLYLANAGDDWTDFSGWGQDDLSGYDVADYDCMAMVYGNWQISGPAVDPPEGDGGQQDDQSETNDVVTFLIEDGGGVYFWVQGEGVTILDAWTSAVENYSIPWVQAEGDNATWGEVDSMYGIGSVNEVVDWQSWPMWSWWMVYTWRNASSEWISDNMASVNSSDCEYCAIYYGNNSVYNEGPSVTPDEAVAWDLSSDGARILIQSPSGLYFWVNGEGTTMFDAWTAAATAYNIDWTKESGYDGIDYIFGIEGSGQYYWKLYLGNAGGNWTNFSGWGEDDLSTFNVTEYNCMAMVYGNWQISGPAVDPPTL